MKEGGVPAPQPRVIATASGVVAIDKPPGLPTQAAAGIDSAESWLRRQLATDTAVPGATSGYLGVPHRLDRAVSGVLLFAVTPRAARKLARQFERREIAKEYVAILAASDDGGAEAKRLAMAGHEGLEWRDFVEKVPDEPRGRVVAEASPGAREAVSRARLLARLADDRLLVRLAPITGRMHQLRLQAATRGLPVVGDPLYGWPDNAAADWSAPRPPADDRARPIALHAWRIRYRDPDTREMVTIAADVPGFWPSDVRGLVASAAAAAG
jgi:23S rRNA pseudouridine1911/1915/1917 synthase